MVPLMCFAFFVLMVQHFYRCFICLKITLGYYQLDKMVIQRGEQIGGLCNPAIDGRRRNSNLITFEPFNLTVNRQMVNKFLNQNVCKKSGTGNTFVNWA